MSVPKFSVIKLLHKTGFRCEVQGAYDGVALIAAPCVMLARALPYPKLGVPEKNVTITHGGKE